MELLLVDDEPLAIDGLVANLQSLHDAFAGIHTANSKAQAIAILEQQKIDMIFCDLEMPGGNGLELLAWVREHRPEVILVILSCHDEFYYAQRAVQLSCFDYILKPATPEVIAPVVRRAAECLQVRRQDRHFRQIGEAYVNQISSSSGDTVDVAEKAKEYIVNHITEEISIEKLAQTLYLSPNHLTRCFKKKYGMTISEYLMELRLSLAAELLSNKEIPVTAVAAKVGYANYAYFIKIFKKKYGVPPMKYRAKN